MHLLTRAEVGGADGAGLAVETAMGRVFAPFESSLWLLLVGTILLIGPIMVTLNRLDRFAVHDPTIRERITDGFYVSSAAFVSADGYSPVTVGSRMINITLRSAPLGLCGALDLVRL